MGIIITKSILCHSLRWLCRLSLWVSSCFTIRPKGIQKSQASKIAAVESSVAIGPMPTPKAHTNPNAYVQFGKVTWHVGLSESVNQIWWRGVSTSRTCAHNSVRLDSFSRRLAVTHYYGLMYRGKTLYSFYSFGCHQVFRMEKETGTCQGTNGVQDFLLLYLKCNHWGKSPTSKGKERHFSWEWWSKFSIKK